MEWRPALESSVPLLAVLGVGRCISNAGGGHILTGLKLEFQVFQFPRVLTIVFPVMKQHSRLHAPPPQRVFQYGSHFSVANTMLIEQAQCKVSLACAGLRAEQAVLL